MDYAGLPIKDDAYLTGYKTCRETTLATIREKTESNRRVLEKLYAIHLRSISWDWPFSSKARRREKMLQRACDRLYYETQALHQTAIEIIEETYGFISEYLNNLLTKTPA